MKNQKTYMEKGKVKRVLEGSSKALLLQLQGHDESVVDSEVVVGMKSQWLLLF